MCCRANISRLYGVDTVEIENDIIRAVILPGKGADLLEFIWKPAGVNCFYHSDEPVETYRNLDLSRERLRCHSDRSLGGWMDALPHRGLYKGMELTQETGGIAATVPWEYRIEEGSDSLELFCHVHLPVFPLLVEKRFSIRKDSPALQIKERVVHMGDDVMRFTWTQHAMFGGDMVGEHTEIYVPSSHVFNAWAHAESPEKPLDDFIFPVRSVALRHGVADLTRPLPKSYPGNEFVVFQSIEDGRAVIFNPEAGLSLSLRWDKNLFPYLRSLYQSDNDYIIGLEPGDDLFSGFTHSREHGTYTTMLPGEVIDTQFELAYASI